MLIYSEHTSERLKYILDYLLIERLGISYSLTQSQEYFNKGQGPKLNYSVHQTPGITTIVPEGLLFEAQVRKKKPSVTFKEGIPIIFKKPGSHHFAFDIFSAAFYFLSRYEEYQHYDADAHGRFPAKESLAFKNIFLTQPVVDHWIIMFRKELQQVYPGLSFKQEQFNSLPTIDVDSPWCYRHKGIMRNLGGIFRDTFHFQFILIFIRLAILLRIRKDPWFMFGWMKKVTAKNNQQPLLFIHAGKYGKYDKSVSSKNIYFRKFVRNIQKDFPIGLHPSYISADKPEVLKQELNTLNKLANLPITHSRQHYLRVKFPEYYRMLIVAGITDDYSMGFADKPGFRAGTSRTFKWFDLLEDKATNLCIHPFAIMDRTVTTYEHQSVMGAQLIYNELIEHVRKVDGQFVTLWHNESFSNLFEWKGWRTLFENVMKQTANNQ